MFSKEKGKHKKEDPKEIEKKEEQKPAESSDQTVAGAEETVSPPAQTPSELQEIQQKLTEANNRNQELEDRLLRLAAEFDNYRKRTAREFENIIKNANENLLLDLTDILNNFSRALQSSPNNQDASGFKSGVELIYNQMKSLLNKEGLEEIKAKGEKFDPALHEAVLQLESDQAEGTILEEITKGFKLNSKVIRHSQVVVAKRKEEKVEHSDQENQITQEGKGE